MKKAHQLGMNPSTASHRLVKDLLYEFAVVRTGTKCHQCGEPMSREDFSIEHIEPWLDSDDPVGLYFDLKNVTFSHHGCNVSASRKREADHGTEKRYNHGCRCKRCKAYKSKMYRQRYTPEKRRDRYLRTGR